MAEISVLSQYGHKVSSYVENNQKIARLPKVSVALRTLWSQESYRKVKRLLSQDEYDLIHVQNFFPLVSPSVYYAAQERNVPIVQAVRNYRFLCPNGQLYRDGHVCEICLKKSAKTAAIHYNCYRDSRAASATAASMLWLHDNLHSWQKVGKFISVSEFVKKKMIEGGFPAEKISVKPNFVYPDPGLSIIKDNYIVYVGRLQPEKGIHTLLATLPKLPRSIRVKVIGEGPLASDVIACAKKYNLEYLGKLSLTDTYDVIGRAMALVIPSVWHEPFGRVVVEAYAKGTAVIGSRMGGIPELIDDGYTGYTFEAGSNEDLAEKIISVMDNKERAIEMGLQGRTKFLRMYTPESNYSMLMDIYGQIKRSS